MRSISESAISEIHLATSIYISSSPLYKQKSKCLSKCLRPAFFIIKIGEFRNLLMIMMNN